MLEKRPHLIPCIVAATVLFLALGSWPYGYYQLLRLVVCGASIYVSFTAYNWQKTWAVWLFGLVAILFNPLIPIHFSREVWKLIDVLCGFMFVAATITFRGYMTPTDKNRGETK
jgi:hypothetical protein